MSCSFARTKPCRLGANARCFVAGALERIPGEKAIQRQRPHSPLSAPANSSHVILLSGSRRMTLQLRSEGHDINRKRVQRIMRTMGIVALGLSRTRRNPRRDTRFIGLKIERPNHVWCADITYIPIGRGFLYLVALMDWASRAVLSWRLSNTMASFWCRGVEEAWEYEAEF